MPYSSKTNKTMVEVNINHLPKVDIANSKWNTLILLDACRYDMFTDMALPYLPQGIMEVRNSTASCTEEWIKKQLVDKDLSDVTGITANPWWGKKGDGIHAHGKKMNFNYIEHVWSWGWDKNLPYKGTVHPSTMILAFERFSKAKRILLHFMQPHAPFLMPSEYYENLPYKNVPGDRFIWDIYKRKEMAKEELMIGYYGNLEMVIPYVKKIIESRKYGRTIITSDHGNLLEGKKVGHGKSYKGDIRAVPWYIIEGKKQ